MSAHFQTEGMKSLALLKDRQFETIQLKAKVDKLMKDDEKTMKILEQCRQEQEFMIRIKSQKQNHLKMIFKTKNELEKKEKQNRESYNKDRKIHIEKMNQNQNNISRKVK